MYQLLFQISRVFFYPFELIFSDNSVLRTAWSDSVRTRAFLLGIPAVFIAIFGIVILTWAQYGVADNLERFYLTEVEKSNKEKIRLNGELLREIRMLQASQRSDVARGTELIPKSDVRRVDLDLHQKREAVFLEKLISLNEEEPDYRFKLAMSCMERKDTSRGLAILAAISPLTQPGHIGGHLFLANFHLSSQANSQSEARRNVNASLIHANNCLTRDQSNVEALRIKARLLLALQSHAQAYEVFEKLYEKDPKHFEALVSINDRLNRSGDNAEILSGSIDRFDKVLNESERLSDPDRVKIWQELSKCYILKGDYEIIEGRLLEEIKLQSASPENSGKRVWAEHLLSKVYAAWLSKYPSKDPASLPSRLELLKKAFLFNSTNELVLRELVRLSAVENAEIAAGAKAVYDPSIQSDAPPLVLNELGAQALSRREYELALRYFERARKRAPRVPEILNNLAYTYLVGANPNPRRAQTLVDEAFRYLQRTKENEQYRTHFHDTRGRALMMQDRTGAAAAEFEFALKGRPDNEEILVSLIECYRAENLDPSAYQKHLDRLRENNAETQE